MRMVPVLLAGVLLAAPMAQSRPTLASMDEARGVVLRALAALGPAATAGVTEAVAVRGTGTFDMAGHFQSPQPGVSSPRPFEEHLLVDPGGQRIAYESRYAGPDGVAQALRWIRPDPETTILVLLANRVAIRMSAAGADFERRTRLLPGVLLQAALSRSASLRLLPPGPDGQPRVSFALETGEAITAEFDRGSGRLTGFAYLADVPLDGDSEVRWTYAAYRDTPIGPFPGGYRVEVSGRPLKTVSFESVGRPAADAPQWSVPEGIALPPPPPPRPPGPAPAGPRGPRVVEAGPGVYRVQGLRGGFHVLFVEFEDFVVACEAPTSWLELDEIPASDVMPGATSASLSETYLRLIRETVPDKPVRYVVLTHGHGDHAGGVRAFVAAGATVLAGAAVRPLIARAVTEPHTIHPDALAAAPRPLRFEAVTSPRTITDGTQRLDLLPVEPNPHAAGLLAVHLPALNALYVADVFQPFNLQRGPSPAERPLMRVFVDWLDRAGLAPDMVFTAHGGGVATAEHLAAVRSGAASR